MAKKEVFVALVSRVPFGAVDQIGQHNFKSYLRKKAFISGKYGQDEIVKVVEDMHSSANKFLAELKELEARTGLTIRAEYPPNQGSFANFPGADFAIGCGVEKMSGVPDRLVRGGLTNPFDGHLMAGLADETGKIFGLTREELDDYAFESRRRALLWQGQHRFIAPVRVRDSLIVDRDEEVDMHAKI